MSSQDRLAKARRRPFVEEFRTFCLSNPSAPNTALGLGNALEELLAIA